LSNVESSSAGDGKAMLRHSETASNKVLAIKKALMRLGIGISSSFRQGGH
jgi:hypothetical protein